jgi:hypothetical protein
LLPQCNIVCSLLDIIGAKQSPLYIRNLMNEHLGQISVTSKNYLKLLCSRDGTASVVARFSSPRDHGVQVITIYLFTAYLVRMPVGLGRIMNVKDGTSLGLLNVRIRECSVQRWNLEFRYFSYDYIVTKRFLHDTDSEEFNTDLSR